MTKKTVESLRGKSFCLTCDRDISGRTHICCQTCENTVLCIVCFSAKREANAHRFSHPYSVVERIDVPLHTPKWTIQQEIQLAEGLEKFGCGNWQEIARWVGGHTDHSAEAHFWTNPLMLPHSPFAGHSGNFSKLADRILAQLEPLMQVAQEKSERLGINLTDKSGYGQVIGYMPLRKEFEVEYNNDAELYIADMEFSPDDSEADVKTKTCILEIYFSRLQEREEKKAFVVEHELIDINEVISRERNMGEEERRVRHQLKDKMPFLTKAEFEELVQCFLRENQLEQFRKDLVELQNCNIETLQDFEDLIFNDALKKANAAEVEAVARAHEKATNSSVISKRAKSKQNHNLDQPNAADHNHANFPVLPKSLLIEADFCNQNGFLFEEYLVIKEFLLRQCLDRGSLSRGRVAEETKLEPKRLGLIFDFLLQNGLIIEQP